MSNIDFWNSHYQKFHITEPSSFARYCVDRWITKNDLVIEIGCGNGRDGVFLFKNCDQYIGIDTSSKALEQFSLQLNEAEPTCSAELLCVNVRDFKFKDVSCKSGGRIVLYSRFSLHSLDEETERHILREFIRLPENSIFALEARTTFDPLSGVGTNVGKNAFITDHYRRFVDPRDYLSFAMENASLEYFALSDGCAITETEDPIVLRAVFGTKEDARL